MSDDLIGDLEAAGFGRGVGYDYRKAGDHRLSTTRTLHVVLPDGKEATRQTARPYKFVVAVLDRDNVWGIFRWTTHLDLANKTVKDATRYGLFPEIRILAVTDDRR